jgi:tryptophan synthase alpha chain
MTRAITRTFDRLKAHGKKAFIPFITAGDPDLETTIHLVPELERSGADIVELGIPFSDPLADGPTIQRASERALRHGYALTDYLEAVRLVRRETDIPVVLFSYFNPILRLGLEAFAAKARDSGVNGVLVTDITPEEAGEYRERMEAHDLDTIFLVAPTSSDQRVARICECTRGFVYLVSRTGVTGVQQSLSGSILPTLRRVREHTELPVAVGFGISGPEHVRAIWEVADGVVVGSAIVAQMESEGQSSDLPARIGSFCRWLTEGRDQ